MKNILTLLAACLAIMPASHAQWNNIAPDGSDYTKIRFTSANTAYVLNGNASSMIMGMSKTTNAGTSWTHVPFNSILNVRDFSFVDDNTGFACADTTGSGFPYTFSLYQTIDGGNTWTTVHTFVGAIPFNAKVYFRDALHGIITETYSRIWTTNDGGATWTSQDFSYVYFQDIVFTSANVGYITCADGTFNYYGVVLKTTNGGTTWNEVFNFGNIPLNYTTAGAVDFVDDNNGYMETMENFYKTTDGGLSWDSLPFSHNNNLYFQDIYFQTLLVGYGCDAQGGIYVTTDGGNTWTVDRTPDTATVLYSIDIWGTNAYAAGSGGKILRKSGINGILEKQPAQDLHFYPNPSSSGVFYLQKKDAHPLEIQVYTITGELVYTRSAFTGNQLDLSALQSGTYLLRYGSGSETLQAQKLTITK